MSFASRAREEIAQRSLQKDCCVRAAAYGFACFAKYFDKGGLVLQTEQPHTVQLARELFARCGVQGDVLEKQRPSGVLYEFNIREPEQGREHPYELHADFQRKPGIAGSPRGCHVCQPVFGASR